MNTNNTAAEFPTWQKGVIYEPTTHKTKIDHSDASEPSPTPDTPAQAPTTREEDAIERHRRKCSICNHSELEAIEQAFLNWQSPDAIVVEYRLPSRSALYRHVEATDLPTLRRRRMHLALDRIIERVDSVTVTGSTVLRAIMMSNQLTKGEQSLNPANINQSIEPDEPISNRDTKLLESTATQTK